MSDDSTRLLYSFLLHSSRLSDEYREGTNPFTLEMVKFYLDKGLDDDAIDSLSELIESYQFDGPEPHDEGYVLQFGDREQIRIRCTDLDEADEIPSIPVELTVKCLTDEVLTIIFDIVKQCHLLLMSMTGEDVRVVNREILPKILHRWPDAEMISGIQELEIWLDYSIEGIRVKI